MASGVRVFLGLEAVLWLPYGIFCFFVPSVLADGAAVVASTPTGATEIRAMYGGLQAAIGVACVMGALSAQRAPEVLRMLLILALGLGGTRLVGAALDDSFTSYTIMALVFEFVTAGGAAVLLRRAEG